MILLILAFQAARVYRTENWLPADKKLFLK
jgi:hypothetical protein